MRKRLIAAAAALGAIWSSGASAVTIADAAGDYAPQYNGAHDADLDVLSFSYDFDPVAQNFLFGATMAGAINTSVIGPYVIGVNTGTPTNNFANLGAPGVVFTRVIILNRDGTGLVSGGGGALDPGSITFSGDHFSAVVPLAKLPSTGFNLREYGFNLWPRNGANQITDFAPDNSTAALVPEPATWAMMILGFGFVAAAMRYRQRRSIRFAFA